MHLVLISIWLLQIIWNSQQIYFPKSHVRNQNQSAIVAPTIEWVSESPTNNCCFEYDFWSLRPGHLPSPPDGWRPGQSLLLVWIIFIVVHWTRRQKFSNILWIVRFLMGFQYCRTRKCLPAKCTTKRSFA